MYKIIEQQIAGNNMRLLFKVEGAWWISFDPDNTDYQKFKSQINAGEAQLEDADGNLMTAKQAKDFIATLP